MPYINVMHQIEVELLQFSSDSKTAKRSKNLLKDTESERV